MLHISYIILRLLVLVDRFLPCLQTLVGCGLSGPTSPLAFGEAVLGAISHNAESLQNKEQLWMVWSAVVSPLTDTITQVRPGALLYGKCCRCLPLIQKKKKKVLEHHF